MPRLIRRGDDGAIPPKTSSHHADLTSHVIDAHMSQCRGMATTCAQTVMTDLMKPWIDAVGELALKAVSNNAQTDFLTAQRQLDAISIELGKQFMASIDAKFDAFYQKSLHTEIHLVDPAEKELGLVEHAELEASLAATAIVQRLDIHYAAQIWMLNQRLSILNGGEHVNENSNPVAPIQFCNAFSVLLKSVSMPAKVKQEGFRLFGQVLSEQLGDLLAAINSELSKAGILSNLKYDPKVVKSRAGSAAVFKPAVSLDQDHDEDSKQDNLMKSILRLQGGGLEKEHTTDKPIVQMEQLLAALESVQKSEVQDDSQVIPHENLRAVLDALSKSTVDASKGKVNVLSEEYNRTIDLVGMVFEFILKDETLPATVKTWLSYLHTPFLKLAFSDETFIVRTDHPARALLNALAEAGSRWIGNDGVAQFSMDEKIKYAVNRVLSKSNNLGVVRDTLKEFNEYTASIQRKQMLLERRATEKMQGVDKLKSVKIRVFEAVCDRLDQKSLSKPAMLFCLNPWSDYLSFMLLRHGDKSPTWASGLKIIEDLLWSLQPGKSEDELAQQKQIFPGLIKSINAGLGAIGFDPKKGKALTTSLVMDISKVQKGHPIEAVSQTQKDQYVKQIAEKLGVTSKTQPQLTEAEKKLVDNLSMIEFGTWFEFEGGRRLKAAWYNAQTSQYLFVDQMGKQESLLTGLELARKMIVKQAKIIAGSSKPFFERALENIYLTLNENNQSGE